jgi:FHA domain-containing protein
MGLQRFERRLERLVEGAFSKAFRSGLQPVEIGRRVVREMDAGRTLGVRGTVVPNQITVSLSNEDLERFAGFRDALAVELADAAREHARDEGYHFSGPVEVTIAADENARRGDLQVRAEIIASAVGAPGTLVLPDGRRVQLGEDRAIIGRLPDCVVALTDPQVSRHHAEIRRDERGYQVVDLDSMNGIQVNGVQVREHLLADGDVILVGATEIRYEES